MTTSEKCTNSLASVLQSKCGACNTCSMLLVSEKKRNEIDECNSDDFSKENVGGSNRLSSLCPQRCELCLGIFSPFSSDRFLALSKSCSDELKRLVKKYAAPYMQNIDSDTLDDLSKNNIEVKDTLQNCLHSDIPSVSLPSDVYIRAYTAMIYLRYHHHMDFTQNFSSNFNINMKIDEFVSQIKDAIKSHVRQYILPQLTVGKNNISLPSDEGKINMHIIFQPCSVPEGTSALINLCCTETHSIVAFPHESCFPIDVRPPIKKIRKRFRGEDPTPKQGGSPITNVEKKAQMKLNQRIVKLLKANSNGEGNGNINKDEILKIQYQYHPVSMAIIQKAIIVLESSSEKEKYGKRLEDWLLDQVRQAARLVDSSLSINPSKGKDISTDVVIETNNPYDIHVAVWRTPFYIKGRYTKNRRDVSQSPFYVSATIENQPTSIPIEKSDRQQNKTKTILVKKGVTSVEEQICSAVSQFACGGISSQNNYDSDEDDDECAKKSPSRGKIVFGMCKFHASGREDIDVRMLGTGRPFVLEIIDAHTLPTLQSLTKAAKYLNTSCEPIFGVGIVESKLSFGNAKNFSGLQSETEDKVKHYGCMCWSEKIIPSQSFLDSKFSLQNTSTSIDRIPITKENPLKIIQATPIRVLHRRSAANRERFIVSLKSKRINDHWFQLWVSTSAGTYVKEFVRGDLGRTNPSIASILSDGDSVPKKADILQLDVMGIEDYGFSATPTIT